MNRTENTLAAQEFLRTLNESSFEQLIRKNTGRDVEKKENTSPFRSDFQPEAPTLFTLPSSTHSNPSSAFEGLQNIFSKTHNKNRPQNEVQQISSQSLDQLSDYEIQLLQKLAKKELYDAFHQVMQRYNQEKVDYTVTLYLFPNGAIKNATLKESSNIKEIDQLAIQAAFQASPFPKPPAKDIANNYQYDIPIIYIKQPE